MGTRVVLTYRDYAALPADGRRWELHEGELFVTASPSLPHQRIVGNLFALLREHVRHTRSGEVVVSPLDVILSDITVVVPDVVYLEPTRSPAATPRGVEGAPTLAVEVLSPSTRHIELGVKLQLYARHGIAWYWIVEADASRIDAYRLAGTEYALAARLDGEVSGALPPFETLRFSPASLSRAS